MTTAAAKRTTIQLEPSVTPEIPRRPPLCGRTDVRPCTLLATMQATPPRTDDGQVKRVTCTYRSQHRFCESCNSNQPLREIGIRLTRNFNVAFLLMRSRKSCRRDALLIRCKIIFYSWLHPRTSLNASQCHGKYTRIKFSHLRQRPSKVSSGRPPVAVQT